MHAGTLEKLLQDGAPGLTGLEKEGLVPVALPVPKAKPELLLIKSLFPDGEYSQLFVAASVPFPSRIVSALRATEEQLVPVLVSAKLWS